MFCGRRDEQSAIDRLVADARRGRSAALVVRGEAGIGKSTLLDHAIARAGDGLRVLRAAGVQPEMELPFAGLHLLLHTVLDELDAPEALPGRQAQALRGALGLEQSSGGDRFIVGLAVLTLLAQVADERPLVCLVDDAQWLDHASAEALLFAARRLDAEGVVLIFAARDGDDLVFEAPGVPELRLHGLDQEAATGLLARHAPDLAPPVRDRLLAEAQGNPLALLELPATLTDAQRAGEVPDDAVGIGIRPVPSRILQAFYERIAELPTGARTLLLIAASANGDLDLALDAAKRMGGGLYDAEPAETAGLVHVADGRITFRHPLVRTAAYQFAPAAIRLAAHRALADALEGRAEDADRRAWHLALAATGPDEDAAYALEESAEHARGRGGYAAVAAAYERAANLTVTSPERGRRLAAAAQAAADGGQHRRAAALADQAAAEPIGPLELVGLAQVRAAVATVQGHPGTAHTLLVEAADAAYGHGATDTASQLYFDAIGAAWLACDFTAVRDTAARVTASRQAHPLARAASGLGRLAAEKPPLGLSSLRDLIEGLRHTDRPLGLQRRAQLAIWDVVIGDDEAARTRALAIERDCRTAGAIGVLPLALVVLARAQMFLGHHRDALSSAEEGYRIAEDSGQRHYQALLTGIMTYLAAVEGDDERCHALADRIADIQDAGTSGMRCAALNLLDLAHGRSEAVLRRARDFDRHAPAARTMMTLHRTQDVVEAAVRLGHLDIARVATARLRTWAPLTEQPWARAVALRCEALMASGADAEQHFVRAVQLHQEGGRPFERARTELLYGEWLRRDRRPGKSRLLLESALEIFQRLDARPWVDRARDELRAAGKRHLAAESPSGVLDRLTARELQIVRLAASGMSNRDIAAQLFLSPRTIGYHLHKAFPKLQVASRGELARLTLSAHSDAP